MTKQDFTDLLEGGWDFAIEKIEKMFKRGDINLLCTIYWCAYQSTDFKATSDPDYGLCFAIRQFAIDQIYKMLEDDPVCP